MADKKLNELGTTENFDNAYVELSQNQYRISKTNLGKQLTKEVHLNFSVASDTPAYIFAQKSDGTNFRISKTDLANALKSDIVGSGGGGSTSVDTFALYDGCFIAVKAGSNEMYAVPYYNYGSNTIDISNIFGIIVIEGGHALLVAPHEQQCYWSSNNGTATTVVSNSTGDRIALLNTWDGKERTEAICASGSPFYSDSLTSTYAPGYCHNYSINGTSTGMFWLPCVAELMMIWSHRYRINTGLSMIIGATQLDGYYWSSTESSPSGAWAVNFFDYINFEGGHPKTTSQKKARPVSAYTGKY